MKLGLALSLPMAQPIYDPSAALSAYLSALSVQPDAAQTARMRTLISALMASGAWSKLDALYLLAVHDAQAARINLKAPASNVLVVNGTTTFTAYQGYQGDGSTGYLQTGFDPSSGTPRYTQDSAHMGAWTTTELATNLAIMGSEQCRIFPRAAANTLSARSNSTVSVANANSVAVGHSLWVRTTSALTRLFKNGAFLSQQTQASSAFIAGQTFRIGGSDQTITDTFSAQQIQVAHYGSQLADGEAAGLYAALRNYLTGVGIA